ncbi:FMN-binding protein [Atribacter laminatus]|jgi:uncharacterized protein with FMN-binding domain|uniref:FMN-binding domain-containing protein n=1 Tax=Atribacter laminatus TaxID=2847778 RepID=A0A7T1AMB0_ATRLM|nr:FMN-binding protein [Atribacter laminatus]QPM68544.1 hypothetical protein RT761_01765 [Atribacter laminatus]
MKKWKKWLLIIGIIIGVFIIGMFYYAMAGMQEIKEMVITDIDLSEVKDGVFSGEFRGNRWSNTLEVTVEDHKITDIKVIKDFGISIPGFSQKFIESLKEKQSLNIDAISQATINTKAYLKSIENALKKGME